RKQQSRSARTDAGDRVASAATRPGGKGAAMTGGRDQSGGSAHDHLARPHGESRADAVPGPDVRPRPWYGSAAGATTAGVGVLLVLAGMAVTHDGDVPSWERRIFRRVNDLPDWLEVPLWPLQQVGALAAAPMV